MAAYKPHVPKYVGICVVCRTQTYTLTPNQTVPCRLGKGICEGQVTTHLDKPGN